MAVLLFGFYKLKNQGVIETSYIELIPSSAIAVIDFKDPKAFYVGLDSNVYSASLKNLGLFKKINPASMMDSSLQLKFMDSIPWHASIHVVGSDKIGLIYFVDKSNIPLFNLRHIKGNGDYESTVFKDVTIHELSNVGTQQKSMSFLDRGNLIAMSEHTYLLEEIIAGLKDGKVLSTNSDFVQIEKMSSKSKTNSFFIQTQQSDLIKSLFSHSKGGKFFQTLPKWTTWLVLQPELKKDQIIFSGYAMGNGDYANTIKGSVPVNSQLINYIPNNAATFTVLSTNDLNSISRLDQQPLDDNFKDHIKPWLGNEMALVRMEYYGSDQSKAQVLIANCQDPGNVLPYLDDYSTETGDPFIYNLSTSLYDLIPIEECESMTTSYFTIKDDMVFFSNSVSILKQMRGLNSANDGMKVNASFQSVEQHLPSSSNLMFYFHPQLASGYLDMHANNTFQSVLEDQKKLLSQSGPLLIKWTSAGSAYIIDGVLDLSNHKASYSSNSVWSTSLESKATSCIYPVVNHYTKDWELFVQDDLNNIYLIDKSGQILWNRKLDAPIISDVHEMDFFKNNKFQYLFNTPFKIHLIDRKGRNTANYPIDLNVETYCGIALFDYDGNKNYRIFANSGNGNLYAYEKNGKPLNGWNPKFNVGELVSPVIHSRYEGKDNIYMLNKDGEFKAFNRRGEERFADIQLDDISANELQFMETKNSVLLYASSTNGRINVINHTGELSNINLDSLSEDHQFIVLDLNEDGQEEFCVLNGSELSIVNNLGEKIVVLQMQSLNATMRKVSLKNKNWISVQEPNNNETLLISLNNDNLVKHQFEASTHITLVDLFKDGSQVAVFGNVSGEITCKRISN